MAQWRGRSALCGGDVSDRWTDSRPSVGGIAPRSVRGWDGDRRPKSGPRDLTSMSLTERWQCGPMAAPGEMGWIIAPDAVFRHVGMDVVMSIWA